MLAIIAISITTRVAFLTSALILAAGALLAGLLIRAGRDDLTVSDLATLTPAT